jgi:hypothetical protein
MRIHGGYGCYPQEYMIEQLYGDRLCRRIPTG